MVSLVASSAAAPSAERTVISKPIRVGVILRQVGGQKSANLNNTELEEVKERYKLMLPQFKKLEKALKLRHATMLKTEEARVGVANVLAEMAKDTPLAEAAGKPTERSTADKAYANAVDAWSTSNQRQCETYKTFAMDYVATWENAVTTRVNADMATTTQLRRDADHYMVKVEQLEKSIAKLDDKGKPVPEATTEKLARNREKLDEANVAYHRAAKNLFLLLEEVVDRAWRDLHPLMLKLLQFDLQLHGAEEKVLCRTITSCIADLQNVSQVHDISQEPRLASLVDGQPMDLTTRPGGVEELDKSFAVPAPVSSSSSTTTPSGSSSTTLRKSAASSAEQPQEQAAPMTTTTQSRYTRTNSDSKTARESNNNSKPERTSSRGASISNGNNNNNNKTPAQAPDSPSKKPWAGLLGGNKNKDNKQEAAETPEKESSGHNRPWNRNKNNNKPEIKRSQENKATKSAATGRSNQTQQHNSTSAGTANQTGNAEDPYANADPGCWLLREMVFNGSAVCVEMGEKEDVKGKSIEDGIEKFKKNPHKYIAMMYQSNMLEWPAANQVYTLIHRKGTVGYEPKGIGPSGHLTLFLFDYQRLPAFKDNVLPKASRDKYTDTVLSKFNGLKLHSNNKPLMPGRGMGCCDMPNLKIIGNVDPSDIAQGSVGNCWLLSGISALAEFDGAVKHLFRKTKNLDQMPLAIKGSSNAGNMYTVSLWDLKTWKEVDIVIDERLCVDNNGQLLASKPSADGELWVCYLEKAIAAHCGGWDKIVGGQCTHAWALLTGCKEQYTIRKNKETGKFECFAKYNPYDKKWAEHANSPHDGVQSMWRAPWPKVGGGGGEKLALDEEELFQRMCAWDDVNYIVGASTEGVSDKNSTDGLVDNHAYSVLESINDVAGTEIDMIKVRNPWGRGEIENGMFDDDGPGWDRYPQIKKALNPAVADDGIFWVTKQEFFHYYGTIYLSASNMTEFLED